MPLILFTGYPSSGKTTQAQRLVDALKARTDVVYHSDDTLGISPAVYADAQAEKLARGSQISAVRRDLARNTTVVLDSLAYIKGFRYQLFCEAKALGTPHCVVHIVASPENCKKWNQRWDADVIDQLVMRYEEPNAASRWDSPLFTVVSGHDELPVDEIWDALTSRKLPPPNAGTVARATSGTSFVQQLEARTQAVVAQILSFQQLHPVGGTALVNGLKVTMPPQPVSAAQLQRIRRTFVGLNRMRPVDEDRVEPMFVDYLNRNLNAE